MLACRRGPGVARGRTKMRKQLTAVNPNTNTISIMKYLQKKARQVPKGETPSMHNTKYIILALSSRRARARARTAQAARRCAEHLARARFP